MKNSAHRGECYLIIVLLFLQYNSKFKIKLKPANLGRCKFISIMHLYREVLGD